MATTVAASAQNVQLHYDLGHSLYNDLGNRPSVTTTVEMFKPDTWGSTYLFTDIDYQRDGVAGAYWEIAREFNVTKNKQWAFHVEYNGGLNSDEDTWNATRFQHAVLAGGAWNWHSADFSRTFSVQALWKYYFKNRHYGARPFNGFQLTEVWGIQFAKGFCTFSGFCDLWYDPSANGKWIVISEPQFWWNLNKFKGWEKINLSVGTEWELSNNFVWNDKGEHNRFYFIPTIAAKWTF
ncbi:hypothetical protein HMPREF0649_01739 [Segatella buccae D17]|nr:hypothetical protein HMPREF0649_01739 [Segatella buccae D17]